MRRDIDKSSLRRSLIDEEFLSREVLREQRMRRENPDVWRWKEDTRLERNEAMKPLNARLRSLGLEPVPADLSLKAREQKLQRLRRSNAAAIAAFTRGPAKAHTSTRGTPLATRAQRRKR